MYMYLHIYIYIGTSKFKTWTHVYLKLCTDAFTLPSEVVVQPLLDPCPCRLR